MPHELATPVEITGEQNMSTIKSHLYKILTLLIYFVSSAATAHTWQQQPLDVSEPNALSLLAIAVGVLIFIKAKNRK